MPDIKMLLPQKWNVYFKGAHFTITGWTNKARRKA